MKASLLLLVCAACFVEGATLDSLYLWDNLKYNLYVARVDALDQMSLELAWSCVECLTRPSYGWATLEPYYSERAKTLYFSAHV